MENKLNDIKERIRAIDPNFSDELLELLREYVNAKNCDINLTRLREDKDFENQVKNLALHKGDIKSG